MPVDASRRSEALRAANRSRGGLTGIASRRRPARRGPGRVWGVLLPALLLFLVLRTFVVEAFRIPSGSMERTLLVGDFLLVNKWRYGARVPFTDRRLPALHAVERDDIVVFAWPVDQDKSFVKRVVGVPGDTLAMVHGALQRNGAVVREAWAQRGGAPGEPIRDDWGPVIVPAGRYFVLGDNRDNSLDSRFWGFVPARLLIGAPWFVYFSFAPNAASPVPWLTHIRWRRIGATVR